MSLRKPRPTVADRPTASYVVRVLDRLGRRTYEVRDLRTGESRRFTDLAGLPGWLGARSRGTLR
ncbi:MAG: hypothetical protein IT520_17040 [Burkholderiales bacterium]|nr:hypothetical protein [Burkholderiales bacterium]